MEKILSINLSAEIKKNLVKLFFLFLSIIPLLVVSQNSFSKASIINVWIDNTEIQITANKIIAWDTKTFEKYGIEYVDFDEVVESSYRYNWDGSYTLRIIASTTWDSLHEYVYKIEIWN